MASHCFLYEAPNPPWETSIHPLRLQVLIARCSSVKGSPRRSLQAKRGWRSWSRWRGTWEVERKLWVSNFCCLLFKRPKNSHKIPQKGDCMKIAKKKQHSVEACFWPRSDHQRFVRWSCPPMSSLPPFLTPMMLQLFPNRLMWFVSFWNIWAMKKNPGWLGYIGDCTTQLCGDSNMPIWMVNLESKENSSPMGFLQSGSTQLDSNWNLVHMMRRLSGNQCPNIGARVYPGKSKTTSY